MLVSTSVLRPAHTQAAAALAATDEELPDAAFCAALGVLTRAPGLLRPDARCQNDAALGERLRWWSTGRFIVAGPRTAPYIAQAAGAGPRAHPGGASACSPPCAR
jgi:hypothetical protein